MPNIPISKHRSDIEEFKSQIGHYKLYARVLKEILEKAKNIYAPLGFVETREKKIESFSEKIIRKDKYKNPLTDMTDLCGARVITHFARQVQDICHFIEENFEIDIENSLDLKTRLRTSEFGYRSIHYIVTPGRSRILNVEIPEEIQNLKAEIQVRTFHEHIWADILHDRIYKSSINVTEDWKRESARLAALLEEADNSFAGISDTIDKLAVNYQATPNPQKLKNEIDILKVLIDLNTEIDNKDALSRLKLARIYNLTGEWTKSVELLLPVMKAKNIDEFIHAGILREMGFAKCNCIEGKSVEGISQLEEAIKIFQKDPSKSQELAMTYKSLADTDDSKALENLDKAHKLSPTNPYYFTALLVERFKEEFSPSGIDLDILSSKTDQILTEFQEHTRLGIEVSEAYLNIGEILFLKSRFSESIENYIYLMKMLLNNQIVCSRETLHRELIKIDKIENIDTFYARIIKGVLHLTIWLKFGEKKSEEFLAQFRSKQKFDTENILIIAGKSAELSEPESKFFREYLDEAMRDFKGTVISGGTSTGIPGLIGSISAEGKKNNSRHFKTIGYLPEEKKTDQDYDDFVKTKSSGFSALEPLTYWIDILFSNIMPEKVFVLGINGGTISAIEYKFAAAIGAKVCLIGKSGGSAQKVAFDPEWNTLSNLLNIPNDPYTVWAIINHNLPGILSKEEIKILAPLVHDFYREKRREELNPEKETDINNFRVIMKWDKLAPSLQNSNFKQVAFMEHIFLRGGLKFFKCEHPERLIIRNDYKTLRLMARLEHARWNAESLLNGWKFGPKDVLKKTTPSLVPWDELDDDLKLYTYNPIRNFPELLLKIGYEVREV
jgi:ppGpp synthetase/RelA/SpoT-type nucleotidyltranferase